MSGSGSAVSMDLGGVKFRHPTASIVHATESLIEYYEDTDVAFDLHIELKADWNTFFRQVPIAGPSGDDDDASLGENTTGAKYYAFGDALPSGMKLPRDRLEDAMDSNPNGSADGFTDINDDSGVGPDTNAEAVFWATAADSLNKTPEDIEYNHMQSVAKGLVGLFSNSSALSEIGADNLVVVDPSAGDTTADPGPGPNVAAADVNFEIRIDQDNLRKWMSQSGEYGANVFTSTQLQELFKAMTDSGRTFMESTDTEIDCTPLRKDTSYETASRGMRFLALRHNDCLQVKIIVNDSVGLNSTEYDLIDERPNHRHWLLSLRQTETGSFDSSQAVALKYKPAA